MELAPAGLLNLSVTPPRSMLGRVTRTHGRDSNRLGGERGGWDWENFLGLSTLLSPEGWKEVRRARRVRRWEIWLTRKGKGMFKCSKARGSQPGIGMQSGTVHADPWILAGLRGKVVGRSRRWELNRRGLMHARESCFSFRRLRVASKGF